MIYINNIFLDKLYFWNNLEYNFLSFDRFNNVSNKCSMCETAALIAPRWLWHPDANYVTFCWWAYSRVTAWASSYWASRQPGIAHTLESVSVSVSVYVTARSSRRPTVYRAYSTKVRRKSRDSRILRPRAKW